MSEATAVIIVIIGIVTIFLVLPAALGIWLKRRDKVRSDARLLIDEQPINTNDARSALNVGGLFLGLGAIGGVFALIMDTTVATGFGRINNIGLLNTQQNLLIVCGVFAIVGAILMAKR